MLERKIKFEFNQIDATAVQSPEDKVDKMNTRVLAVMGKCRNLDSFYDVIFELDGGNLIKANSLVLFARSDYFKTMFNSRYGFKENSLSHLANVSSQQTKVKKVKVSGIPRQYFAAIIQYLYTDHFCQTETTLTYYLRLMIYADYFMLTRLVEICSE